MSSKLASFCRPYYLVFRGLSNLPIFSFSGFSDISGFLNFHSCKSFCHLTLIRSLFDFRFHDTAVHIRFDEEPVSEEKSQSLNKKKHVLEQNDQTSDQNDQLSDQVSDEPDSSFPVNFEDHFKDQQELHPNPQETARTGRNSFRYVPKQGALKLRHRQASSSGSERSLSATSANSIDAANAVTKSKKRISLKFKPNKIFKSVTKGLSSKSLSLNDITGGKSSKKSDSLPNIKAEFELKIEEEVDNASLQESNLEPSAQKDDFEEKFVPPIVPERAKRGKKSSTLNKILSPKIRNSFSKHEAEQNTEKKKKHLISRAVHKVRTSMYLQTLIV